MVVGVAPSPERVEAVTSAEGETGVGICCLRGKAASLAAN
jgi:hypothetical protein